jgi:hypothetical protein
MGPEVVRFIRDRLDGAGVERVDGSGGGRARFLELVRLGIEGWERRLRSFVLVLEGEE